MVRDEADPIGVVLTPAQSMLYQVLAEASPGLLTRERICMALADRGRSTSRTSLRQQIHRLENALGKGSLLYRGDSLGLKTTAPQVEQPLVKPIESVETLGQPVYDALVDSFRDTVAGLAAISPDDARAMLISQSWFAKALSAPSMLKLLAVTRPTSQDSHYFGEHRNLETLVLMGQGSPKRESMARLEKTKKIARRLGQRSVYRTAAVLETFAIAGESELPSTPELSQAELVKLSMHQKLAYLALLFLENQVERVLRTTEAVVPMLAGESPSNQLHFWTNATVLSAIAEGRSFAEEARRQCELAPGYRYDRTAQRCVLMSLARDQLHRRNIEAAEDAANRYWQISRQMGWHDLDAHEILAQTSMMRGDVLSARRHRTAWIEKVECSGHGQKRFLMGIRRRLDAVVP